MLRRVQEYAALGAHRTGGLADEPTVVWMAAALEQAGLVVEGRTAPYPGWTGRSELHVDGEPLDHLLVPYGWNGSVDTADVVVGSFDPRSGGLPSVLDDAVAAHDTGGRPLLLTTDHPDDELVGVNRHDLGVRWSHPVVLCAGRELDRLQRGDLRLRAEGRAHDAHATNLVASNGVDGRPLVLTTPVNGWFGCAGERGTGIAVLLELVGRLADLPLLVLATTGHELGYFGVRALMPWLQDQQVTATFHIGASVAVLAGDVADPDRPLASTRVAFTSLSADEAPPVAESLTPAALSLIPDTDRWLGEATVLSELPVPLLSVTGAGADFHTPADTPERVTSAAALATVADAFEAAARRLHESSTSNLAVT